MSIFKDQLDFMDMMDQPVGDRRQASLYARLIDEEYMELSDALYRYQVSSKQDAEGLADVIDGAIDLIYVTVGLLNSMAVDCQAAWDEVHISNMSKMGRDGKAIKDGNGKVIKGPDYTPPNLIPIARDALLAQSYLMSLCRVTEKGECE